MTKLVPVSRRHRITRNASMMASITPTPIYKLEIKFLLRTNEMMRGKGASWIYDIQVGHMRSLKIRVKAASSTGF